MDNGIYYLTHLYETLSLIWNAHANNIDRKSSGLNAVKSLDYDPHPCGSPFGSGIACLNSLQTNLSR